MCIQVWSSEERAQLEIMTGDGTWSNKDEGGYREGAQGDKETHQVQGLRQTDT